MVQLSNTSATIKQESEEVNDLKERVRQLEAALRAKGDTDTMSTDNETISRPNSNSHSASMAMNPLDTDYTPEQLAMSPTSASPVSMIPNPSVLAHDQMLEALPARQPIAQLSPAQASFCHQIPNTSVSMTNQADQQSATNLATPFITYPTVKVETSSTDVPATHGAHPTPNMYSNSMASTHVPAAPEFQQLATPQSASKQCQCKKSRCLKLYCECFAANAYCQDCKCSDCHNTPEFADERLKAMQYKLSRRAGAFDPKFQANSATEQKKSTEKVRHSRGCNCKKSGCNKRYCECFQNGVTCGALCRCTGCKNEPTTTKEPTMPGMTEWRIPLSEFQVRAQGTKVYNKRRACPADFVPGQEATWFIVPGSATPIAEMAHAPAPVVPQHSRGKHAMSGVALSAPRPKRHRANSDMSEDSIVSQRPLAMRTASEESLTISTRPSSPADSVYCSSQGSDEDSDLDLEIELLDPESVDLFGFDNDCESAEDTCMWLSSLPSDSSLNWEGEPSLVDTQSSAGTQSSAEDSIEDFSIDEIDVDAVHSTQEGASLMSLDTVSTHSSDTLYDDKESSNTCEPMDELWMDGAILCDKQHKEEWTSSGEFPFDCLEM